MSSNFKTPLSVYVLYDKDNTKGSETYEKIYHLLCRNSSRPFEDGLDIPVFFRTDMANQITPIDINFSNKTIAILLVDDNMYCNTIWDEYIKELLAYIIHSGFISGYQNRYGDNLKPPTNVYHRMTA